MPDVINTEVDGVEPSIPVRLLDISDNPERVKLKTADDGTDRFLVKGSDKALLVTSNDLVALGGVGIEIENSHDSVPAPEEEAPTRPEVIVSPPVNPIPGQTGQ